MDRQSFRTLSLRASDLTDETEVNILSVIELLLRLCFVQSVGFADGANETLLQLPAARLRLALKSCNEGGERPPVPLLLLHGAGVMTALFLIDKSLQDDDLESVKSDSSSAMFSSLLPYADL